MPRYQFSISQHLQWLFVNRFRLRKARRSESSRLICFKLFLTRHNFRPQEFEGQFPFMTDEDRSYKELLFTNIELKKKRPLSFHIIKSNQKIKFPIENIGKKTQESLPVAFLEKIVCHSGCLFSCFNWRLLTTSCLVHCWHFSCISGKQRKFNVEWIFDDPQTTNIFVDMLPRAIFKLDNCVCWNIFKSSRKQEIR